MPSTSFPAGTVTLGNNKTWARAGMFLCFPSLIHVLFNPRQEIDPENPEFGDQGLYFAIWKRHGQKLFRDLSVSWDMTHCRYSWVSSPVLCDNRRSQYPVAMAFLWPMAAIAWMNRSRCQNRFLRDKARFTIGGVSYTPPYCICTPPP